MKKLNEKVVVITGAGSGIGRSLAVAFAAEGCLLALSDINPPELAETVKQLKLSGDRVAGFDVDVADREAMEKFASDVVDKFGHVDIVVNNAGIACKGPVAEIDYEIFEKVIDVNMWGVVYGTRAFLPYLKQRSEATLVNISSIFGVAPSPGTGPYNMSKFAVLGLNETLMMELKGTPVGVLSVHPGGIQTNIANNSLGMDKQTKVDFNKLLMTTAPSTARAIVKAIKSGKSQVFIGPDAKVMQALKRIWPGATRWASMRVFGKIAQ